VAVALKYLIPFTLYDQPLAARNRGGVLATYL